MGRGRRGASFDCEILVAKLPTLFIKLGTTNRIYIAVLCWFFVIFGSWMNDFHRPPEFYLSKKSNILNVVFAKWSLAWTFGLLAPFMALTYWRRSRSNLKVVCKHLLRLVASYVVWYTLIAILEFVEHQSGKCEGSDLYTTKQECHREGLLWNGFDISGHSFILIYCSLIISEEIQVIRYWRKDNQLRSSGHDERESGTTENVTCCIALVLYISCCLLMMLWIFLLAITSVYFHSTNSKLLGTILGLGAWYGTYNILFLSVKFPGAAVGS